MAFLPVSQTGVLSQCTILGNKKQLYTYLAMLGATSSVAEFNKVCPQFEQLYTYLGSAGHFALPSLVTEFDKVCTQF